MVCAFSRSFLGSRLVSSKRRYPASRSSAPKGHKADRLATDEARNKTTVARRIKPLKLRKLPMKEQLLGGMLLILFPMALQKRLSWPEADPDCRVAALL